MLPGVRPQNAYPWHAMAAVLSVTAALQAAGTGLWYRDGETPLFEVLVFDWGWSEDLATSLDAASAWIQFGLCAGFLVIGGLLAAKRLIANRLGRLRQLAAGALGLAGVWQLLLVLAAWYRNENFRPAQSWGPLEDWLGNWQVLGETTTRIAAPWAGCWLLLLGADNADAPRRARHVVWLLQIAAAVTFAVHGYEALRGNARFVDLILAADRMFSSGELSEQAARRILWPIAAADFAVALGILISRRPGVAAYMAGWGLLTALSRLVHSGDGGLWETLVRAPNCGVPLAICLYWLSYPARPPAPAPDPAPALDPADHVSPVR